MDDHELRGDPVQLTAPEAEAAIDAIMESPVVYLGRHQSTDAISAARKLAVLYGIPWEWETPGPGLEDA